MFRFEIGPAKAKSKYQKANDKPVEERAKMPHVRADPWDLQPHSYYTHLREELTAFASLWKSMGGRVLHDLCYGDDVRLRKTLDAAARIVNGVDVKALLTEEPSGYTASVMEDVCRLVKPPNFFGPLDWKKAIQEDDFKKKLLGLKDQVEYFVRQQSQVDQKGNYNTGHMELARLRRLVKSRSVADCDDGLCLILFTTNLVYDFFSDSSHMHVV